MAYVQELEQYEVNDFVFNQRFQLWWSDFEEAGVDRLFVAFDDEDDVIGFQTINRDGLCVAIEVIESAKGQGVGRLLVEESNCWRPEQNECPEFWAKMAEELGW